MLSSTKNSLCYLYFSSLVWDSSYTVGGTLAQVLILHSAMCMFLWILHIVCMLFNLAQSMHMFIFPMENRSQMLKEVCRCPRSIRIFFRPVTVIIFQLRSAIWHLSVSGDMILITAVAHMATLFFVFCDMAFYSTNHITWLLLQL